MNFRRRTTMIGPGGGNPQGSSIPQPSVLRPSRASLAPGTIYQQPPPSVMRTLKRVDRDALATPAVSRARQGANPGVGDAPMTQARNNLKFTAQTPMDRQNRVIQSAMRRQSMGINHLASAVKKKVQDVRPLRDANFKAEAQNAIADFLAEMGYPEVITPKTLKTPTQKDFKSIFQFVYSKIDPRYNYQGSFDNEVLEVLKSLRYPYVNNITKSHIHSAGSTHAWPTLLPMLMWLVELARYIQQVEAKDVENILSEGEDMNQYAERAFHEYLTKSYPLWLNGEDETPDLEAELAGQLDDKNEHVVKENEQIETKLKELETELHRLQSIESPLVQHEREKANLMSDKVKLSNYIHKIELKRQKLSDRVAYLRDLYGNAEKERAQLEAERDEVKAIVDSQEVSTQDVDRMQAEREQLYNTLEGIQLKIQEAEKSAWDQEMRVQRIQDSVENSVQEYMNRAFKLGLVSAGGGSGSGSAFVGMPDSGGQDGKGRKDSNAHDPLAELDIQLKVDYQTDDPTRLTSVDLRRQVRPALQRVREQQLDKLRKMQSEVLEVYERADQLGETKQELEEQIRELETKVQRKQQQYVDARELMMTENKSKMHQIEQLEADILAMRKEIQQSEINVQSMVARAEGEWDMVKRQSDQRRKTVSDEITGCTDEVAQMSNHVQQKLKELQELCASEAAQP
ncbi:kinetochore-associated Ndc80 complex subunit ndc80 [Spiromyces aspiralis]|uniref:Kinetochore-associated Ndc80 complex subunit ndc80 n=1 Tax=Spiromyces aspiralis TaxID=68401 RepID=A0ACC1HXK8_9FUNG|nr:kinetochore-associated Ndc80 complex subunit ndc80 [Spiromyces aspiralis]